MLDKVKELTPEEQRALLAQLLREQNKPKTKVAPLSFGQERLWFLDQLVPNSAAYNLRLAARLRGRLDVAALRRSLNAILARHETLRTTFRQANNRVQQLIHVSGEFALEIVEGVSPDDINHLADLEAQKPFDLVNGPLIRGQLLCVSPDEHVLLVTMHHTTSDGWSLALFMQELATLYQAFAQNKPNPLSDLRVQYGEFARWQREQFNGAKLQAQVAYWHEQLAGQLPALDLPTDHPRPALQTYSGARHYFKVDAATTAGIKAIQQQHGATLFMMLLTAYKILLHRYAGQSDILVGTPVAGRSRNQLESLIGLFINTLVLRSDLGDDPTFAALLKQVKATSLDAFANQDVPFEKLVETLKPVRDPSRSPIFQVLFILQNAPMERLQLPTLELEMLMPDKASSQFDITMTMWDGDEQFRGYLEYNTDLFDAATTERMVGHFLNLLRDVVADVNRPISTYNLLDSAEKTTLTQTWNQTSTPIDLSVTVADLFEARVAQTPNKTAVRCDDTKLTYAELDARANQVANQLLEWGVSAETRIGLSINRSVEMLVGLLGIIKSGAAYVPIDPNFPANRIAHMIDDAAIQILVTTSDLNKRFDADTFQLLNLDQPISTATGHPPVKPSGDDCAYVIYTSGSTGKPKGVQIEHASLTNFLLTMADCPGLSADDVLLAVTTISFDIASLELYAPLIVGATVVIADQSQVADGVALRQLLSESGTTIMQATPATWRLLLASGWNGDFQLKILCGGEALQQDLARALLPICHSLWNMYGPTETTIWSTTHHVLATDVDEQNSVVTIGKPIANTDIFILDKGLQPVPIGVTGDLYIGGAGVARGYLNRPKLSAERFTQTPYGRLYNTGDLCLYRPDGTLHFLGRSDHQVKIRGYRIELGEIETQLGQHHAIHQTVVVAQPDPSGSQRLVAYFVADGSAPSTSDLRQFLRGSLPDYMIPTLFMALEAFPLTPNGKVNRLALPKPDGVVSAEFTSAQTDLQQLLVGVWQQLLGVPQVGIHDNFFELGGHSLLATQLLTRIRDTVGVELSLPAFFGAATVADMAASIEKAQKLGDMPPIQTHPLDQPLPLSFAQQRLWILDKIDPNLPTYNIPAVVRLRGRVDGAALSQTLNTIVERHAVLRTTFGTQNGEPVQLIAPTLSLPLITQSVTHLPTNQREDGAKQLVQAVFKQPFKLTEAPLLRTHLIELEDDDHLLVMVMHHIISDGWSINILVDEMRAIYPALLNGEPSPLPALPLQYADFAQWQRSWLQGDVLDQQIEFWRDELAGAPTLLSLPTDHPRPPVQSYNGSSVPVEISAEIAHQLNQLSKQHGATLFMTLMAAFQLLLSRLSGQNDVSIGSPIANRTRSEIENLIGFFVNTLVFRGRLDDQPSFVQHLKRVRQHAIQAYAHQDVPFEKLVDALNPQRDTSHSPLFQAMLILQNAMLETVELPDLTLEPWQAESTSAKFDLLLTLTERGDGLRGSLEYNSDLFERSTVERWLGHFETLLKSIVATPDRPADQLSLLTTDEQSAILHEVNQTEAPLPAVLVDGLVTAQAQRLADKVAVRDRVRTLSYAELETQADHLAAVLVGMGLRRGDRVGVALSRTHRMLVALLGIWKAGLTYIPLDPMFPQQRLAFMLADADPRLIVTEKTLQGQMPLPEIGRLFIEDALAQKAPVSTLPKRSPEDTAYIIYTSGSTGKPKGVMVPHRAIVNFLLSMQQAPGFTEADTLLAVTTLSFDIAVLELFLPLISGGTVAILPGAAAVDANALQTALLDSGATVMQATPATWQLLVSAGWQGLKSLKILCGGEALSAELATDLLSKSAELWNLYGPTETTVWSTIQQVTQVDHATVTIGQPIANTTVYIVDDHMRPVPTGVAGHLLIGGAGVTQGYLNRDVLSAEKFIPSPFPIADDRFNQLYRTGDLARFTTNGNIEFLGRSDFQVKIRGFRIELGEIENVILAQANIAEAVVIVREDTPNDKRIVAYVVTQSGTVNASELRSTLRQSLPEYMVPAHFEQLDKLPLTPNDKIDRKALPAPTKQKHLNGKKAFSPPTNAVEKGLAAILQTVLGIEAVDVHDNFFDLGAHSLLLIQAHEKIQTELDIELPIVDIFRFSTIHALAKHIEKGKVSAEIILDDVQRREQLRRANRRKRRVRR